MSERSGGETTGPRVGDDRDPSPLRDPMASLQTADDDSNGDDGPGGDGADGGGSGDLGYDVDVGEVRECGTTCREVSIALTNTGTVAATELVAETRISTGGTIIWTDTESIGRLDAGETYRTTRRVELSVEDGARVRRNDNVVSIQLVLRAVEGDVVKSTAYDLDSGSRTRPPLPDLREGTETAVSVDGSRYLVIDELPNQPPNRVAVTTPGYELVDRSLAKAAVATREWPKLRWSRLDWNDQIERTRRMRENEARDRTLGRIVDLGWDVTEIFLFTSAGIPPVGPAIDAAADVIDWSMDAVERPWQQAYQRLTATLGNARSIESMTTDVSRYEDVGPELANAINLGLDFRSAVRTGTTLAAAWDDVLSAAGNGAYGPSVSATAKLSLSKTSGFFLGTGISLTVGSVESAVKRKTTTHAIGHAVTTCRIPLLRQLMATDERLAGADPTMGDGHAYYLSLLSDYQLRAIGFDAIERYWRTIADSTGGIIWDTVANASGEADRAATNARQNREMAHTVAKIYGQAEARIDTLATQSLNAAVAETAASSVGGAATLDGAVASGRGVGR
jgi:hypothetical protein